MPATTRRRTRKQSSRDADRLARAHAAFLRLHKTEEARTIRALKPVLDAQAAKIVERLARADAHPAVEQLFNPAELRVPFNVAMSPRWLRMTEGGISLERDWINAATGDDRKKQDADADEYVRSMVMIKMPAPMQSAVARWLHERQIGVWQKVADSTKDQLAYQLAQGLRHGDTNNDLTARVKLALQHYTDVEARRVARTEGTGSMNFGEHLARIEADIAWKEWIATVDIRTRGADPKRKSKFNHYAANHQKVPNKGVFIVSGEQLKYPGDTSQGASAGNVVNCRCGSNAAFDPPPAQPVSAPTPPGAVVGDPMEKRLVVSKASVELLEDAEEIGKASQAIFGRKLAEADYASIVGAPDTAKVSVMRTGRKLNELEIVIEDETLKLEAARRISLEEGKIVVHNDIFEVLEKKNQGQGIGREMFARQVAYSIRMGVDRIECLAARTGSMNGYYTWAAFGYEGLIPWEARDMLKMATELPEALRQAENISELMSSAEGAAWWKKHGKSFHATFKLDWASYSLKVLRRYLMKKDGLQSYRPRPQLREAIAQEARKKVKGQHEDPGDLPPEDEALLLAAHQEVAAEEKRTK